MQSKLSSKKLAYPLALLCCGLWGSAYPAIKIGFQLFEIDASDIPTILFFAGMRFFLGGCITLVIASLSQKRFARPKKGSWGKILLVALFQTAVQYIFFYIGLAHTTGVKSTIINSSNVFFIILISAVFFRQEKMTARKLLGCLLGFAGVFLINMDGLELSFHLLGDGFILIASLAYSLSSVLIKRFSASEDPLILTGYQFLVGGGILLAGGYALGGRLETVTPGGLLILIYLSMTASVTYSVWSLLLKHNPVSRIALFVFFTPAVGVILSALLLHEALGMGWMLSVALILVCLGIIVVNRE